MSFTVVCNDCGSEKVVIDGDLDCIAVITCENCGQVKYGDDFKK